MKTKIPLVRYNREYDVICWYDENGHRYTEYQEFANFPQCKGIKSEVQINQLGKRALNGNVAAKMKLFYIASLSNHPLTVAAVVELCDLFLGLDNQECRVLGKLCELRLSECPSKDRSLLTGTIDLCKRKDDKQKGMIRRLWRSYWLA
jgi:hypothetical protein